METIMNSTNRCAMVAFLLLLLAAACPAPLLAADWPQWLGTQRDGIWRETGLMDRFPASGPPVIWRAPLGAGYSGPSVAGDRVYVMDRLRPVDESGKPARPTRAGIPGKERLLCLSAGSGKILWQHAYDCPYKISYPSGPRMTPLVQDGRVYALGAMGHLCCLDAESGKLIWSRNLLAEYQTEVPIWGYAAHLLLDGDLLYSLVGGEGSAAVAFHKDTGKEAWRALTSTEVCYSPPVIYSLAGKRQLIIWLSDSVNGLDPASGKVNWTLAYPVKKAGSPGPAVNIATVRNQGERLLVSNAYFGTLLLDLSAGKPQVVWNMQNKNPQKTEFLSCLIPSPVIKEGHVYGVSFMGELCCLDLAKGKELWRTYAATGGKDSDCGTAFLVPEGDHFVIFNDQGELILADLTPAGYREIGRARILEPVQAARGRQVVWSHPAFAHRCVFARNDKEMVCVSLAQKS
jgi:outer membrane protein assembly factor BamB